MAERHAQPRITRDHVRIAIGVVDRRITKQTHELKIESNITE